MNSIEIWRNVPGYEDVYQVSNFGNVKSLRFGKEKLLKFITTRFGYKQAALYKDGKQKNFFVHRLVWWAFNGEIPKHLTVDHINNYKHDNNLSNLQLLTQRENNWKAHLGRKRSAETRKKMSLAHLGKKYGPRKKKSKTFLLNLPPAISRFLKEEIHKEFPDEIVIEKGA